MTVLQASFHDLERRITERTAHVGVIGLGYVGLPLAITVANQGFRVTGFDIDPDKITALNAYQSYIEAVSDEALTAVSKPGRFTSTTSFTQIERCDIVIICVPTPLTKHRDPDLSFVENTSRAIAAKLRPGQLIVLNRPHTPARRTMSYAPYWRRQG